MNNFNFSEMSYDELQAHVKLAIDVLTSRAYNQGKADADLGKQCLQATRRNFAKSQQQQRDEIIEKAKCDVTDLKNTNGNGEYFYITDGPRSPWCCKVDFVINRDKRTVVALMRGYWHADNIYARGIAKCDPSDCFNVHIGKAIALRRALGLEVPAEYFNAPQPTEVRVGNKILYCGFDPKFDGKVETVSGFNYCGHILTEESTGCIEKEDLDGIKIIDDSRE